MEWPSAPVRLLPSPCLPRSALCSGLKRNWRSVLACSVATMTTSPPRPPSPPLGPPCGTYFSRRNARHPLPPSPALTRIRTSSINIEKPPAVQVRWLGGLIGKLFGSGDADELAEAAAVFEHDRARYLRKERVVLAPAHVRTRLDLGTALPDDDGTAGHQLAAENFHA